jgi:transcriptional regulator of acetoin/glycerol metabolism
MVRYNFVAKNCHKIQEQKLEDNEFVEIVKMNLADFRKHLQSGELTDVESGYLCLDYLKLL